MPRRKKGLGRGGALRRGVPLRSTRSGRARPDEPLAVWCAARIEGVCTGRATHRHHRLMRSAGGDDSAGNTSDLCADCHRFVHANPAFGYESGYLLRRP